MPRLFTLDEANALLPQLKELLPMLLNMTKGLQGVNGELKELYKLPRLNGHTPRAEELARDKSYLEKRLRAQYRRLEQLGVELKDLSTGLVDFRSNREGRVVYLCWRLGEPSIGYWHELDGGVVGRQPL